MRWDKVFRNLFKNYKKFLNINDPFDRAIIEVVEDCKLKIDVVFLGK